MPGSSKLINIEDVSGRVLIVDDDKNEIYALTQLVSDSLSMGDITENYIYGEQNWSISTPIKEIDYGYEEISEESLN